MGGVLLLAVVIAGSSVATAEGAMVLRLSSGGDVVEIEDGSAMDSNNLAGAITYIGDVGNFIANVPTNVLRPSPHAIGIEPRPITNIVTNPTFAELRQAVRRAG